MKVYLASQGTYSDYRIVGVFTRREDAEAYELGESVEEFELYDGPQEVRDWHTLNWCPDYPEQDMWKDGIPRNPYEEPVERRHYDGHPNTVECRWIRPWGHRGSGVLRISGWDLQRIYKVYGEQRAMWLNNRALGMVWDSNRFEWTLGE